MQYNKNKNYIGNSKRLKEYTKHFYKKCSALNYTSYCHDILYGNLLFREKNIFNRFILKMFFDLIFLKLGLIRALLKFQIHSIPVIIICYTILLLSTPFQSLWLKK